MKKIDGEIDKICKYWKKYVSQHRSLPIEKDTVFKEKIFEIYNKLYQLNMEYELLMCYTLRWLMMGIMRPFGSERVS